MVFKKYKKTIFVILLVIVTTILFKYTNLYKAFLFENFKENREYFFNIVQRNYFFSIILYMCLVALIVVSTLPIGGLLALFAGSLFGVFWGATYTIIGSTIGCIISFLLIRYFFGKKLQKKYAQRLEKFNKNVETYGASVVLTANLMMVPFFLTNTLAALTKISLKKFSVATFLGMIPSIFVYAYAGRQLIKINSFNEIFSSNIITAFILLILLSLIPIFLKKFKMH